jgi:threonine/homoserine/homoserine lactone efflux protein
MSLDAFLFFCAMEAALCVTPGPAVLTVVSTALRRGAGAGLRASLGILAANTFYFALSATGVGAVVIASHDLFFAIKWAGAAYLIWLGLRSLLRPRRAPAEPQEGARGLGPFASGLVTQGANPKALVFFAALLPQFVDPAAAVVPQVLILGAASVLIELLVLALYAALADRARRAVSRTTLASGIDRIAGLLLVGAGAGLATLRRAP